MRAVPSPFNCRQVLGLILICLQKAIFGSAGVHTFGG